MRKNLLLVSIATLLTLAACGGGNDRPEFPDLGTGTGGGGGTPVATNAVVRGKIAFEGTPPAPARIQMSADPYCAQNAGEAVDESVVVSDGGLENVILYISDGLSQSQFPVPNNEILVDQQGCRYIPHVFTVQTGQTVRIRNSDGTLHNIHSFPMKNRPINMGQPVRNQENTALFDQEEVAVPIRCDVHKWMSAFVGVFDHPFHTVSKAGGAFELRLPAGSYQITAHHETLGEQTQMVTVAADGTAELNFTFRAGTPAD